MKIAVSATGPNLSSEVDQLFARAAYYVFVDSETREFETIENPNRMLAGGAAIESAQLIARKGAQVVLTGNCGPNAFRVLALGGVQVIAGVSGTVAQAVEAFRNNAYRPAQGPTPASGLDRGRWGLLSGGRGLGRGRGRRGGRVPPPFPAVPDVQSNAAPAAPDTESELGQLKHQAKVMKAQLSAILKRIRELEKHTE